MGRRMLFLSCLLQPWLFGNSHFSSPVLRTTCFQTRSPVHPARCGVLYWSGTVRLLLTGSQYTSLWSVGCAPGSRPLRSFVVFHSACSSKVNLLIKSSSEAGALSVTINDQATTLSGKITSDGTSYSNKGFPHSHKTVRLFNLALKILPLTRTLPKHLMVWRVSLICAISISSGTVTSSPWATSKPSPLHHLFSSGTNSVCHTYYF